MTLDAYFSRDDAETLTALAERVGVSKGRLSQIRTGQPCPPDLALKIESATGGMVSASDLNHVIARARAA